MTRCVATAQGWDGKRVIQPGEEFYFDGPAGSWFKRLGGEEESEEGMSRDQVKAALEALGVEYNVRAGTEALKKLLQTALAKTEQ